MGNEHSLVFSGIAPHPPIMVPEVGRDAISEVLQSIAAMRELTKRIIQNNAETVVLIGNFTLTLPTSAPLTRGSKRSSIRNCCRRLLSPAAMRISVSSEFQE
jgi:hypothetical protein